MERYEGERAAAAPQQAYSMADPWSHGRLYNNGFSTGPSAPYAGAPYAGARGAGSGPPGGHGGFPPVITPHLQVLPLSFRPPPRECFLPLRAPPLMPPFHPLQPQLLRSPPLPPDLSLRVLPLSTDFQHLYPRPMHEAPSVSLHPSYTRPGTVKVEGPRPRMWPPLPESMSPGLPRQQIMYPVQVKPELDRPVVVKEEVKVEKDLFYDSMSWDDEEEDGADDLALSGHICDTMVIDGECRCGDSSPTELTALPRPPPLDLKSLEVLDVKREPEVIDLSSRGNSPDSPISISSSPPTSPVRTASEELSELLSASQARDARLAALRKVVTKIELEDCPSEPEVTPSEPEVSPSEPEDSPSSYFPPGFEGAIVPLSIPQVETAVPANGMSLVSQPPHRQDKGGKAIGKAPARGNACESGQLSASKKRKANSGKEAQASNGSPLDELISLGKLDSAIRLPKLEMDGVLVEDPHREKVVAVRESFDRLRVAIQRECQEHTLLLRRPDLKAASVMRQKGLWLNFSNVIGPIRGVRVGDWFPFRITLCVLGLHRHIRAGIGYVPEKDSDYKMSYATSVVIGKDKVYKDDVDNGERVEYTGQGGLVMKKKEAKLLGATPTDQKLVRGNLALDNSLKLGIPVRVMRGHSCLSSPSGVIYTYDGLYKIENREYVPGLDGRMVYKFVLQRLKDQEPLVPFVADATPLQAVPSVSEDSLRLKIPLQAVPSVSETPLQALPSVSETPLQALPSVSEDSLRLANF